MEQYKYNSVLLIGAEYIEFQGMHLILGGIWMGRNLGDAFGPDAIFWDESGPTQF